MPSAHWIDWVNIGDSCGSGLTETINILNESSIMINAIHADGRLIDRGDI